MIAPQPTYSCQNGCSRSCYATCHGQTHTRAHIGTRCSFCQQSTWGLLANFKRLCQSQLSLTHTPNALSWGYHISCHQLQTPPQPHPLRYPYHVRLVCSSPPCWCAQISSLHVVPASLSFLTLNSGHPIIITIAHNADCNLSSLTSLLKSTHMPHMPAVRCRCPFWLRYLGIEKKWGSAWLSNHQPIP